MQQIKRDLNAGNHRRIRIARRVLGSLAAVILLCIIWPNPFYYFVMRTFPDGSNFPYRAASQLGENGSVFFIKLGLKSSHLETKSLMIYPAIRQYLEHHGGTEEIWDVIMELLTDPQLATRFESIDISYLKQCVYGDVIPVPGEKKAERVLYFPVEKVQWANEHIFKKPRNYRIPEELIKKTSNK